MRVQVPPLALNEVLMNLEFIGTLFISDYLVEQNGRNCSLQSIDLSIYYMYKDGDLYENS